MLLLGFAQPAVRADPPGATAPPVPTHLATLGWNPSHDRNTAGYLLLCGTTRGVYTNQLDVGNTNSAALTGPQANVTYYFSVVAYDATGQWSPPSKEIAHTVPANSPVGGGPEPGVRIGGTRVGAVLRLGFPGSAGRTYNIQASQDLQHWLRPCVESLLHGSI